MKLKDKKYGFIHLMKPWDVVKDTFTYRYEYISVPLFKSATKSAEMKQYAVKVRRHMPWSRVCCHGCTLCWFKRSQFHSQFNLRWHSLCITLKSLKSTTLVHMRSGNAWTIKPWQHSEWRLGFNSVLECECHKRNCFGY